MLCRLQNKNAALFGADTIHATWSWVISPYGWEERQQKTFFFAEIKRQFCL
jgi:hypothetical protein